MIVKVKGRIRIVLSETKGIPARKDEISKETYRVIKNSGTENKNNCECVNSEHELKSTSVLKLPNSNFVTV